MTGSQISQTAVVICAALAVTGCTTTVGGAAVAAQAPQAPKHAPMTTSTRPAPALAH